ncbi:CHAT domain-containing protein [Trichocoleus sp. FACHB-262]|uniref:CHAT domain-containing protein n=1 Tax=Trichocoleus sp. FACHB-262 TaxID=2692869 RepID=UPI001685F289|nr:CHAT domain-containing protein [Trichocoleus sp. FACHB-262]MBD2120538.1 CHAT domain-containing protein [Trichocoleus sp. FACHB-262]
MLPRRRWSWLIACFLTILITTAPWHGQAAVPIERLLQQSQQQYESGKLEDAKILLQTVLQQAKAKNDTLTSAIALSNLALIAIQQGHWKEANRVISQSIQSLETLDDSSAKTVVLAQTFKVQGKLYLAQGNASQALESWKKATVAYQQIGDATGEIESALQQVQAFQSLGLYRQAYEKILEPLQTKIQQQPDSIAKVQGLRKLGEVMSVVSDLKEVKQGEALSSKSNQVKVQAKEIVRESVTIAQQLNHLPEIQASQLTLANLIAAEIRQTQGASSLKKREQEQLRKATVEARNLYSQVAATPSPNQLQANLNLLALLIDLDHLTEAAQLANSLKPVMANLSSDRGSIEARLNFSHSLLKLQKRGRSTDQDAIAILIKAVNQAKDLQDPLLRANALGNLGQAQEQQRQLQAAQFTTEQALFLAQSIPLTHKISSLDQVYRWSAQLGRLQEKQGDRLGAIASYTQAVNTLKRLRTDLAGSTDALILEQDALEPVHRQLVNLLLPSNGSQPSTEDLKKARDVIESLQLEEINNYLKSNCIQAVEIDVEVPPKTAVIYPIVLSNRIITIVSVKDRGSKLYPTTVDQEAVRTTVEALQAGLRKSYSLEYQEPSKQLYEWLITPISEELQQEKVETLVFVLDGAFRSVPMAALSDGEQFLIEKYSIATTPGLKLSDPQPLQAKALSGIAFGLTERRTVKLPDGSSQLFSELPSIDLELKVFQAEINPSTTTENKNFTHDQFVKSLKKSQAPIVHLATHGQFSANRDQTFLVAFDGVINIDELATALGSGSDTRTTPIELLVLSACETAIGDDRAPLGLAGMALKSGARSTVASLWKVNDDATSILMQKFYKEVASRKVTKAVALQQAQRAILKDSKFGGHPYFWAPFILVGNWL